MDMDKDILEKARSLLTKQKESGKLSNRAENTFDFKEIEELVLALHSYGQNFNTIFEVLKDQNGLTMTRSTFHRYYRPLIKKYKQRVEKAVQLAADAENGEQRQKPQKKEIKPTEDKNPRLMQNSMHTAEELVSTLIGTGKTEQTEEKTEEQPKNSSSIILQGYTFGKK